MPIAIFGAGGFGREIARFVGPTDQSDQVVFVSDYDEPITNGRRVLRLEDVAPEFQVVIAVADSASRRQIADRCTARGLKFASVQAPQAIQYDQVEIAEGAILCAGTIVTSNVRIGRHFHLNLNSYVAHDCVVGDFVTFAPNVCCNGNVTIEDDVYIGTGALLKPGITLGRGSVVGMGAVVTKNVAPGEIVVGNPARSLRPQA